MGNNFDLQAAPFPAMCCAGADTLPGKRFSKNAEQHDIDVRALHVGDNAGPAQPVNGASRGKAAKDAGKGTRKGAAKTAGKSSGKGKGKGAAAGGAAGATRATANAALGAQAAPPPDRNMTSARQAKPMYQRRDPPDRTLASLTAEVERQVAAISYPLEFEQVGAREFWIEGHTVTVDWSEDWWMRPSTGFVPLAVYEGGEETDDGDFFSFLQNVAQAAEAEAAAAEPASPFAVQDGYSTYKEDANLRPVRMPVAPESNLKNQLSFPEEQATNRMQAMHLAVSQANRREEYEGSFTTGRNGDFKPSQYNNPYGWFAGR